MGGQGAPRAYSISSEKGKGVSGERCPRGPLSGRDEKDRREELKSRRTKVKVENQKRAGNVSRYCVLPERERFGSP